MRTAVKQVEFTDIKPESWEKILRKKRIGFIFKYGILAWGCSMAFAVSFFMLFFVSAFGIKGGVIDALILSGGFKFIIGAFILFPLIGGLFCASIWKKFHNKYFNAN